MRVDGRAVLLGLAEYFPGADGVERVEAVVEHDGDADHRVSLFGQDRAMPE